MQYTGHIRARNTAPHSENQIHDDRVAAEYGFRGGLVPGVTVYGYMASAVISRLSKEWLERGFMQVRFHDPFYDGDELEVKTDTADGAALRVTAGHPAGAVCATGMAGIWEGSHSPADAFAERALPGMDERALACWDALAPGTVLGTLREKLDLSDRALQEELGFDTEAERSAMFFGPSGVAHPAVLLGLANRIMVRNFKLGPWIHAGSEVKNLGMARHHDQITMTGRILERFERKGHEFAVLDLALAVHGGHVIQRIRHTVIYLPKGKLRTPDTVC